MIVRRCLLGLTLVLWVSLGWAADLDAMQLPATEPAAAGATPAPAFSAAVNASSDPTKSNQFFELYGLLLCNDPQYTCVTVRKGQTWAGRFPNEQKRDLVMRLNRTNVALKYRHWLILPKNLAKANYMQLSPMPHHISATGEKEIIVNLKKFAFGAYNPDGQLVYWGPATGGRAWCADLDRTCKSATGKFRIWNIKGAECKSRTYPIAAKDGKNGGAHMPYCMFYYRGFAIHGSTLSGFTNRSRGCVRLFVGDAEWLAKNFVTPGTRAIVKS